MKYSLIIEQENYGYTVSDLKKSEVINILLNELGEKLVKIEIKKDSPRLMENPKNDNVTKN